MVPRMDEYEKSLKIVCRQLSVSFKPVNQYSSDEMSAENSDLIDLNYLLDTSDLVAEHWELNSSTRLLIL